MIQGSEAGPDSMRSKKGVALPVIALSPFSHFRLRLETEGCGSLAEQPLPALRNEFGRHAMAVNRK